MAEGYGLRARRKRPAPTGGYQEDSALSQLLQLTEKCKKIVVFTGSGLSANSGMSMFSTKGGLYERARKKFKISDGIKLFSYPFYKQRRLDVQAFFAQIYSEAQSSRAAQGHHALAELWRMGLLARHYTLNIDGLAEVVGMDTWHHERNPGGVTVEMHGNIRDMVCPECHAVEPLSRPIINAMKQRQPVPCTSCGKAEKRFKVMLYDDEEGDCITPEDIWESLEADLAEADMVMWVGISFEQSASTEYFRKVRYFLSSMGRLEACRQVLVNPSDEALFNLLSSCANRGDVNVLEVLGTSDDVLSAMAARMRKVLGVKAVPLPMLPLEAAAACLDEDLQAGEAASAACLAPPLLSPGGAGPLPPGMPAGSSSWVQLGERAPHGGHLDVKAELEQQHNQQQQQDQQQHVHGHGRDTESIKEEGPEQQHKGNGSISGTCSRPMSRAASLEGLSRQQLRLQQMEEWHKTSNSDPPGHGAEGEEEEDKDEEQRRDSRERRQAAREQQHEQQQHEQQQQEQQRLQQQHQQHQQQQALALATALLAGSSGSSTLNLASGLGLALPPAHQAPLFGLLPGLALHAQLHAQAQVQQLQNGAGLLLPPIPGLSLPFQLSPTPPAAFPAAAPAAAAATAAEAPASMAAADPLAYHGLLPVQPLSLPQLPPLSAPSPSPANSGVALVPQHISALLGLLQQHQRQPPQAASLLAFASAGSGAAGSGPQ